MLKLISTFSILLFGILAQAALPPQFSECLSNTINPTVSVYDVKEIAKVTKVTYCQNQVGLISKYETINMLGSPNVQMGISLANSNYSVSDFVEMGRAGTFVLYVDSARLTRGDLVSISREGVQLVIMTLNSGLTKTDLLGIANARPFVLNVNSQLSRQDLRDFVAAGIQVVIRTSQSGIGRADIVDVASANSAMITVMP